MPRPFDGCLVRLDHEQSKGWADMRMTLGQNMAKQEHFEVLAGAGVRLGDTYPKPIVDVKESREAALAAFSALRETK